MSLVVGWLLDPEEVEELLRRFPPAYPDVVAHHVTLRPGASPSTPLPAETAGEIVGEADDSAGVQALVISIGGGTDRPTGGTYHITWSLDRSRGRKPVESNDVIAARGWTPCEPVTLTLRPARF